MNGEKISEWAKNHFWKNKQRDVENQCQLLVVTLYYLADEGKMRKVAYTFGLGNATVSMGF